MNLRIACYWFSLNSISFAFITRAKCYKDYLQADDSKRYKKNLSQNRPMNFLRWWCVWQLYAYNNCTIMMIEKITPVKAIFFTKISVALTCAWPPLPNATKVDVILFKIWWYLCYLCSILLLFPLLSSVYEYRDDPVILAKSVCLSCAVLQVTLKMMICRIRYNRFQVCI